MMHQYLLIYHVNIVLSIIQCIGIRTEDKQNGKTKLMPSNFENRILNGRRNFFSKTNWNADRKINIIDLSIRNQFPSFLFQYLA